MNYRLNALTSHETGAEIRGLDLKAPVGAELRKALNAEFAKYHVLVFRDQKMTAPEFAHAGEVFGELMSHHHKNVRADGHPEVYEVRNERIAPDQYRIAGATFHTDHQWRYGDMVIWDNRSVMHQANGDYDMNETRYLYRIMITGERVLAAEPASVAA